MWAGSPREPPGRTRPDGHCRPCGLLTGPAVFYRLLEMQEGDRVSITGEDGELYEYDVTHTADFPKDDFPTQEVFGLSADDELRLITCTGVFDEQNGRHLDNRVVFAEAID